MNCLVAVINGFLFNRHVHHTLQFEYPCQHGLCHNELLGDWY